MQCAICDLKICELVAKQYLSLEIKKSNNGIQEICYVRTHRFRTHNMHDVLIINEVLIQWCRAANLHAEEDVDDDASEFS